MTGTPATPGTGTWIKRVTEYTGQHATRQVSITIGP
jgi:hypothetical protein